MSRFPVPWRWPAWVWLGLIAVIFTIRFPIHFIFYPPYLMDLDVYRAVALRLVEGGGAHLYDPTSTDVMMFKYAPCWAVAWVPLAWLPAQTAAIAWSALTVVWFVLSCWLTQRLCARAGLNPPAWLPVAVALLLSRPLTAEFLNGQVDVLWGALVLGALALRLANRSWLSALLLALAIALKLPALIVWLDLVARRQWRDAGRVVAAFTAVNAAACALLYPAAPWQLAIRWWSVLWSSGVSRAFEIGNQSLLALAGRFLSADPYRLNVLGLPPRGVLLVTLAALGLLFLLVLAGRRRRSDSTSRDVFDGALLTLLMVLGSPTVWIATYSACILPVAVGVSCAIGQPRATWRHPLPALLASVLVLLSFMTHSGFWHAIGVRYVRGESYVFLVLMILPWLGLALFTYLWQQRRVLLRA